MCPVAADGSVTACLTDGGGSFCRNSPDDSECTYDESGTDTPVPARRAFDFRVIVHVDATRAARLLKEVTFMWQEGTTRIDPVTLLEETDVPGAFVLVANDERISEFTGAALRDGVPVGYRVSSAAYDIDRKLKLTIVLYVTDDAVSYSDIHHYGEEVRSAADSITAAIGGRNPWRDAAPTT